MSERDKWVRAMSPARRQEIVTMAKRLTRATGIDIERAEQLILSGIYANEQRSKGQSPTAGSGTSDAASRRGRE